MLGEHVTLYTEKKTILVELDFYRSAHLAITHRYDEGPKIVEKICTELYKKKK